MATLQQKIMRRVWAIFFLRTLTSFPALRIYTLAFLTWQTVSVVSVRDVLANMPRIADIGHLWTFYVSAFMHAEFLAQALLLAMIAVGGFSVWRAFIYLRRSFGGAYGQYAL